MRTAPRFFNRIALNVVAVLAMAIGVQSSFAADAMDKSLPDSTLLYVEVKNVKDLRDAFNQTQTGKLWADPAMKPFVDDIKEKLNESNGKVKNALGMDLYQLLNIPQGGASVAVFPIEGKPPVGVLITADAGANGEQMASVMKKVTKFAEDDGSKVSTEDFQGASLTVIKGKNDENAPPLVWTSKGSVYHIGVGLNSVKSVLAKANREDCLANNEEYKKARKKMGGSHVFAFLDINGAIKTIIENAPDENGNLQQVEGILQAIGLNNLKSISAVLDMNSDKYDQVLKIFVAAPQPAQGILRLLQMPRLAMKPEAWVPATVSSYQSQSWDLDEAFNGFVELVNQFAPGTVGVIEQQISGAGEPISFQKDIFDPLGDRITVASITKADAKPGEIPPSLFGIALENAKTFQATINKLMKLAGSQPQKREFQGVDIHDIEIPEIPGAAGQFPEKISLAIAKDTLFISTDAKLLEQALRGGPSLGDTDEYKAFAKFLPETVSSVTFAKPEEAAKSSYDMIKNGQLDEAFEPARATGANIPKIGDMISIDKIPGFEVFKKYLSKGGAYWIQDDDGITITNFSVKPQKP